MFACFLPYKANTHRIYIYMCNVNSAKMHVESFGVSPLQDWL